MMGSPCNSSLLSYEVFPVKIGDFDLSEIALVKDSLWWSCSTSVFGHASSFFFWFDLAVRDAFAVRFLLCHEFRFAGSFSRGLTS